MNGNELKLKLAATIFVGMMDRRSEPGYTDESALGESMRLAGLMVDIDTPKPDSELLELLKRTQTYILVGVLKPASDSKDQSELLLSDITAAITKLEGD
jgi:hypothetical protein